MLVELFVIDLCFFETLVRDFFDVNSLNQERILK